MILKIAKTQMELNNFIQSTKVVKVGLNNRILILSDSEFQLWRMKQNKKNHTIVLYYT